MTAANEIDPTTASGIPVRIAPREQFIAEKRAIWYHAYDGLKFYLETTPTTGTLGATTETFTTADCANTLSLRISARATGFATAGAGQANGNVGTLPPGGYSTDKPINDFRGAPR